MRQNAGRTLSAAYQSEDPVRSKRMLESLARQLESLARQLERKHPWAAASLRAGLDETTRFAPPAGVLTVMRFRLPAQLARTLSTTNPLDFINRRIRKTTHNLARWEGGDMVLRWLAVGSPRSLESLPEASWPPRHVQARCWAPRSRREAQTGRRWRR